MTDTAHTPLPWWIDDDGFIAAGSGDDYQTVADPHCRPTVDYGDENGANAAFILRACNSHYNLLQAGQAVIDNWERGDLAAAVRDLDAVIREARRAP